ncbi:galectin-8-like protein [Leptotrombidium deliense]|uniref:Galectin n=1 Tax=Leptotrombidium deliense TaxID=299467 RepID=A0A443SIZ3_9ACAR|nr:galectin-8-like protein [Leptotrombidium deliense]
MDWQNRTLIGKRFGIDLIHDYYNRFDRRDIVFHLNPRFRQQSVVRNTRINGHWGPEERERNLMPIKPNERFEIVILVTSKAYRVFINGKHFTDYKHRLAFTSVTNLGLWGDIHVNKVQIRYNPEFATINNILPFMKSFNDNLIGHVYSEKMSGKIMQSLKRRGKKNIRLHLDLSLEDPQKKTMKNGAKSNLKIDANIPVYKK